MDALLSEGFVLENACDFEFFPTATVLSGKIYCLSGIRLEVIKVIGFVSGKGKTGMVQTQDCTYNACIAHHGNIVRYDYPHPDHHCFFHCHVYDPLGSLPEQVIELKSAEAFPTLSEALRELHDWHDKNADKLHLTIPGLPPRV